MTAAGKLIPLLLAWSGIVLVLQRRFPRHLGPKAAGCAMGFCSGIAGAAFLLAIYKDDFVYSLVKTVTGCGFLILAGVAAASLYRAAGRRDRSVRLLPGCCRSCAVYGAILASALVAGAICGIRLVPQSGELSLPALLLAGTAGVLIAVVAPSLERLLSPVIAVTNETMLLTVISLLLFMSAFVLRLDLFTPLTMKVMKFIHDSVHQFFETMLLPDHLFARADVWTYIGYLFSSGVGFWGGLIVWFAPATCVILALRLEPLPSVAHIRQGAKRRKLLAAFIRERRCRLILPWVVVLLLAAAVYKSRFPDVEYWDPQPLPVSKLSSGKIVIPKKGEVDLADGKLHKYLFTDGGHEVRFILLTTPEGRLTATLDACAICKPQGYGQAEGSVVCYYCKTLIPLETVGKPGGCNPVPVDFDEQTDGVVIDAITLLNSWISTVSATDRTTEGGK
jgi:hypothetical protein